MRNRPLWFFPAALLALFVHADLHAQTKGSLEEDLAGAIDLVVAADGSGDHSTLQAAVNAVPNGQASVIFIRKGEYREKVLIPSSKSRLTLIGEDADSTVIVYDDYAGRVVDGVELNTFTSQTVRIDAPDFKAMNLTFENDARPEGSGSGQNVAVSSYGDRSIFLHCRFVAWQDTYYSGSDDRQYFKDCYIEGAVDYIFGHSTVIFDSCQIQTVRSGGYITAASTLEDYQFGYVFRDCNLTAPPEITNVYLGRPWKTFARTVFLECEEYECISPTGWHVWGGREESCFYAEYQCTGPGSDTSKRVDWSHQLSLAQAEAYTMENVFSASSSVAFSRDWDPGVESDSLWSLVQKHSTLFMDPMNTDARIASLLKDGSTLESWDPEVYEYSIEVGSDTSRMPVLEAEAVNPLATVSIDYPEGLPGFATVQVLARDGATHSTYRIYFSVDGSYTNSSLDSIRIANKLLEGFDSEIFDYEVVLPQGTSKYFGLTGYPQVKAARVITKKPASLPGPATLEVIAVDGETRSTYTLDISLATGISGRADEHPVLICFHPVEDRIELVLDLEHPSGLYVRIWDLAGKMQSESEFSSLVEGRNHLTMDAPLLQGIYLYTIESAERYWSGKLLISQ